MTKELLKRNPLGSYPTVIIEEVIKGYDIQALGAKLLAGHREDPGEGNKHG